MGIEAFPEIESFHKLPHQVIVKGGNSVFNAREGAELRGIVINNIGHTIRDIKVNLVIFDDLRIPVLNTTATPNPEILPQGEMATFLFQVKDYPKAITDFHLYANWRFDDRS